MNLIRYTKRQVALMVTVAMHFNPSFATQACEPAARAAMVAAGIMAPTPAILESFDLRKDGKRYVWNPR
jgi:hypothetical protein